MLASDYQPGVMIQKNLWDDGRNKEILKNCSAKERQRAFIYHKNRFQDSDPKLRPKIKIGAEQQGASLGNWLVAKNLKKLASNSVVPQQQDAVETNSAPKKLRRGDMTALAYAQQMASAITQGTTSNSPGHNIYQRIGIYGAESGHGMAAAVSHSGKVAFFDPNFGEFNFKSKDDFVQWWPEFLEITKYSNILDKSYDIASFVPRS